MDEPGKGLSGDLSIPGRRVREGERDGLRLWPAVLRALAREADHAWCRGGPGTQARERVPGFRLPHERRTSAARYTASTGPEPTSVESS